MRVLTAAIASEALLVIFSLCLCTLFDVEVFWNPSGHFAALGSLLALPPLLLNEALWRYSRRRPHSVYSRFSREIIIPLCRQITLPTAVAVAILSGACEELFFRGALNVVAQAHLGAIGACAITSVIFAAIHFVGNVRRFGGMIPLYTLMGAYMWTAAHFTGSLFCAAVLHGVYNFIAIVRIKRASRQATNSRDTFS
jgi:membrane protease YdiL (CAAX protease family)